MEAVAHTFQTDLRWRGATGQGHAAYSRTHTLAIPPAKAELLLSADPAFQGSSELMNPEQLLLAAVSSCQLLTFLAMAARARIDVTDYHDEAEALMPADQTPVRITRILLRPRVVVAPGSDVERVRKLVFRANDHCFIANRVSADITIEPRIEIGAAPGLA